MTLIAQSTTYSGLDPRTGKPCHRPGHTREASGHIRAARRRVSLGLHVAAGMLNTRTGIGTCTLCGGAGTLALGLPVTLELAHDIPQCQGGAVCWCSTVLAHNACNKVQGDDTRLSDWAMHADPRPLAAMLDWTAYEGNRARFGTTSGAVRACRVQVSGWEPLTPASAPLSDAIRARLVGYVMRTGPEFLAGVRLSR